MIISIHYNSSSVLSLSIRKFITGVGWVEERNPSQSMGYPYFDKQRSLSKPKMMGFLRLPILPTIFAFRSPVAHVEHGTQTYVASHPLF
jgi:hypothetical protein